MRGPNRCCTDTIQNTVGISRVVNSDSHHSVISQSTYLKFLFCQNQRFYLVIWVALDRDPKHVPLVPAILTHLWPKSAKNGHKCRILAVGSRGDSERVAQLGTRLERDSTHPGWTAGTNFWTWNGGGMVSGWWKTKIPWGKIQKNIIVKISCLHWPIVMSWGRYRIECFILLWSLLEKVLKF